MDLCVGQGIERHHTVPDAPSRHLAIYCILFVQSDGHFQIAIVVACESVDCRRN